MSCSDDYIIDGVSVYNTFTNDHGLSIRTSIVSNDPKDQHSINSCMNRIQTLLSHITPTDKCFVWQILINMILSITAVIEQLETADNLKWWNKAYFFPSWDKWYDQAIPDTTV